MEKSQIPKTERACVVFLCWGSPWPGYSGSALRTQGLLKEIAHAYEVKLVVLTEKRLSDGQKMECLKYSNEIVEIKMRKDSITDKVRLLWLIGAGARPYHPAIVAASFKGNPIEDLLRGSNNIVYCAGSHFYAIVDAHKNNHNWIIDQFDAEVEYWRLRACELRNPGKKVAAHINRMLTKRFCRAMYRNAGCIVSVCEEDKGLTKSLEPEARVEVIENGVDCGYYRPRSGNGTTRVKRILFTGTSNERNMKGLIYFLKYIYPRVQNEMERIEIVIAGSFDSDAQKVLSKHAKIIFTGIIEDIRPIYEMCDVFINPFSEAYGSKLKVSQALSMGMCIVTTKNGARGFPLEDGKTALIANDDDEFIGKLLLALENESLRIMIGANGRKLAEDQLDWRVLGNRLRGIIGETEGRIETENT